MRADVNVSVRRPGDALGTRCELKNLNSIRFVRQAIEVEARRQIEIIKDGGTIDQETRLFDPDRAETRPMRSKEESHDYRYFPDPDLPPLELDPDWVEEIRASLPELPDAKKARYMEDFGLTVYDAGVLVAERETAEFFETVAEGRDAKTAANWITSDLFGALNKTDTSIIDSPVTAECLGGLIDLIADDTISGRIAKDVFEIMIETGAAAPDIVEERGLRQVTDTVAIETVIDGIITANPGQVEQYQSGNQKVMGWFVGQVMKETQGKANPKAVNEILRAKLGVSE
jgi:aspartyl-tRNA(Asn)/glutamyl-tRNA(Gln) amidotransferase subunit B